MNVFGSLAVATMLVAGGMVRPAVAQEGVTPIYGATWDQTTSLGSSVLLNASPDGTKNFTLKNGAQLSIDTKLTSVNSWSYPTSDYTTGVNAISAIQGGSINITGEAAGDGKLPIITITNKSNEFYWKNPNPLSGMNSEAGSNYAISCHNKYTTGAPSILNVTNVNLNLEHVAEGIIASGGNSAINIDNEFVRITADHFDDLQHHAITVQNGSSINIDSKEVILKVSGKSTEDNDPYTVFSSGIHTCYGGSINISAEDSLSIAVDTVNTSNPSAQNYGVYALGQYGEKGDIDLAGKKFTVDVSGASQGSTGLVAASLGESSSLSADFGNISIKADGDGIKSQTLPSQSEGFEAKVNVSATDKLDIAAQNGIVANTRYGQSTIAVQAGDMSVAAKDYAVLGWSDLTQNDTASTTISVTGNNITLRSGMAGVYSDVRNLHGNTSLIDVQADTGLTINAPLVAYSFSGGASAENGTINLNTDGRGRTRLTGAIVALHKSQTNVGLNTKDSFWEGFAQDARADANQTGTINVTATEGATWHVRPVTDDYAAVAGDSKSYLTTWNSQDSSNIDLRQGNGTYQAVDIDTLQGRGTTFHLATDIDGERGEGKSTDQAIIHSGSGAHKIHVTPTGREMPEYQKDYLVLHLEENGATSTRITDPASGTTSITGPADLSFTLANPGRKVDIGLYEYKLATRDAQGNEGDAQAPTAGTEWYLQRTGELSPSGGTEAALSGFAGHYALWWGQITDLRKRLGEIRYGTQDGLWVRGFADMARLDGLGGTDFTQYLYGGSIGYDTLAAEAEEYMWLVGMQLRTARAHQEVGGSGGHGDLTSMGVGLYSTWAHVDGWYADAVATVDWFNHSIHAAMRDGTRVNDDRSSYGLGVSLEVGRKMDFAFSNEGRDYWFVEPQLQLAYLWVKGGDFTASNGMEIRQEDMDSLTGRAGLVLGRKFALDGWNGERYMQPYVKGGVNHEFLGDQTARINGVRMTSSMEGTRVYYGAGLDWQATDDLRLYMQVEREHGEHFTREYNASVGLKWEF